MQNGGMYDWNDIRCFLAVARSGSTLGAAKELAVNQTTAARRIEALEQALGLKLFERGHTGSRMTDAAKALLPAAETLERAARALGDKVAANLAIMPALPEFRRLFPDIQVQIIVLDQLLDLWKGEADVAVRGASRVDDPGLIARRVGDVPWAVYASRDYVARHGRPTSLEALNDHQLIGGEDRCADVHAVKWMLAGAPRGHIQCLCNTLSNLHQAVRAGLGCAPLPCLVAGADDDLVRCLAAPGLDGIFLITTPELRDAPRVRAFLDFMAPILQARIRQLNEASRASSD
jgi:DNA-binding transcriptional LysR family regulator